MSFSQEALLQIAHLARLTIADPAQQQRDMDRIVTMVEKIEAVKTNVAPMAHPLDMVQPLTPDVVTECLDRDPKYPERALLQSTAPREEIKEGLYLVPKAVE